MATVESLANAHQRAMQRLSEQAEREIERLWRRYGTPNVSSVEYAQFLGASRNVIARSRQRAADAAETFYERVRWLAGETDPYEWVSRAALTPGEGAFLTQRLTEAGPLAVQKRILAGLDLGEAVNRSVSGVAGTSGQYVQYASRGSIMQTAARDSRTVAGRYYRIAHAGCCAICGIAASRGAVYRTDKRRYHTYCRCDVAPAFEGSRGPVGIGAKAAAMYSEMKGSSLAKFEELWEAGGRGA
ncbi:MAG: hypothetical protein H0X35_10520 [Pseudonocardiales bacterium]|nr:hypothetical protein [Pseudonocardiales bacterium]